MIGRLTGKILSCSPDLVLLDVAGVGYELRIPLSTFYELSGSSESTISLHVTTHVREDALQLYGFASLDERSLFEKLIAISGVGPRLALAILSGIGVNDLHVAVLGRDHGRLQKIPGVGKKTAERVVLELRDKLDLVEPPAGRAAGSGVDVSAQQEVGVQADALSALLNLGYSRQIADRAVTRALSATDDPPRLETVLRDALSGLVR